MDAVAAAIWTLVILLVGGAVYTYVCSRVIPIHADPNRDTQARRQLNLAAIEGLGDSAEGADIIFVHGLGSNPDTTWTARTITSQRVNWVTDIFPGDLTTELRSSSRLYFFNYDTYWRRDALKIELKHVAADLLSELINLTKASTHVGASMNYSMQAQADNAQHGLTRPRRSFILVAHSFGGLVVKKALTEAPDDVLDAVRGVLFLGTPHSGARSAWIVKLIAQSWTLLGANAAIFDELRHGSLYLQELQQAYKRAVKARKIRTFNFFEQRLVPGIDATFGDSDNEVFNIGMPTDHSGLNKFASNLSPGYDKICLALIDILSSISVERRIAARDRHVIPETLNDCYAERPVLSDQLEALMQTPSTSSSFAHAAVLLGAGGMGKTQLVLRYLRSHDQEYDSILWIDARTENTVKASFRRCCDAHKLAIGSWGGTASGESTAAIRSSPEVIAMHNWLRLTPERWLMVIDSADDLTWNIRDALPIGRDEESVGSIIMTSQDSKCPALLGHACGQIMVESLSSDEAVEVLSRTVGVRSPTSQVQHLLKDVSRQLGELPLALDVAGTTIKNSTTDGDVVAALQRYVENFRNHKDEMLLSNEFRGLHHARQTLWTTWDSAFAAITLSNPSSQDLPLRLLVLMAYLAPSGVQSNFFELLTMTMTESGPTFELWDNYRLTQAIGVLCRFHLIKITTHDPETFNMHDLIRWRARKAGTASFVAALPMMLSRLCNYVHVHPTVVDVRRTLLPHIPPHHAMGAVLDVTQFEFGAKMAWYAMYEIGMLLQSQEWYREAELYFQHAASIAEAEPRLLHGHLSIILLLLSDLYIETGCYEASAGVLQRLDSLNKQNNAWNPDEGLQEASDSEHGDSPRTADGKLAHWSPLDTATSVMRQETLAHMDALIASGRYDEAELHGTETLNRLRVTFGSRHVEVLSLMSDMSNIFAPAGETVRAMTMEESALAGWDSHRDDVRLPESLCTSPAHLRTMCRLGRLYLEQPCTDDDGRHIKALALADRVLIGLLEMSSTTQKFETVLAVYQLGAMLYCGCPNVKTVLEDKWHDAAVKLLLQVIAMLSHVGEDGAELRAETEECLAKLSQKQNVRLLQRLFEARARMLGDIRREMTATRPRSQTH